MVAKALTAVDKKYVSSCFELGGTVGNVIREISTTLYINKNKSF